MLYQVDVLKTQKYSNLESIILIGKFILVFDMALSKALSIFWC